MKGLQYFHRLGEASNYHSPFDGALLSAAEGLRANGSLRPSTAFFRFIGSCPGIIDACCHGDDEIQVYTELCQIVNEWIETLKKDESLCHRLPRVEI